MDSSNNVSKASTKATALAVNEVENLPPTSLHFSKHTYPPIGSAGPQSLKDLLISSAEGASSETTMPNHHAPGELQDQTHTTMSKSTSCSNAAERLPPRPGMSFEALPPEIRVMIYRCCIANIRKNEDLAIIGTSRMIYEEFKVEFWSKADIMIGYGHGWKDQMEASRISWNSIDGAEVPFGPWRYLSYANCLALIRGLKIRRLVLHFNVRKFFGYAVAPWKVHRWKEIMVLAKEAIQTAIKIDELKICLSGAYSVRQGFYTGNPFDLFFVKRFEDVSHVLQNLGNVQRVSGSVDLARGTFLYRFPEERQSLLEAKRRLCVGGDLFLYGHRWNTESSG